MFSKTLFSRGNRAVPQGVRNYSSKSVNKNVGNFNELLIQKETKKVGYYDRFTSSNPEDIMFPRPSGPLGLSSEIVPESVVKNPDFSVIGEAMTKFRQEYDHDYGESWNPDDYMSKNRP